MLRTRPLRANGHLCALADGTEVTVFEDAALPRGLSPFIPQLGSARCRTCDAALRLDVSDDAVSVREPCPYPDGITTVITLEVPSGKLIVSDSLRPVYDWRDEDLTASYNSALGQAQAIGVMAKAGCAFGYVGNTSPGLFRTADGTYVIASLDYYPGEDDDELPAEEATPPGWTLLAQVCTDLWAYSIADFEDWASRGGNALALGYGDTIVDVPPGDYQFTCHTGERSFNRETGGTVIYAHARRTREGNYAP